MKILLDIQVIAEKEDEVEFHIVKELVPRTRKMGNVGQPIQDTAVAESISYEVEEAICKSRIDINSIRDLTEKTGLDIKGLYKFHGVGTVEDLLKAQAEQIKQLQEHPGIKAHGAPVSHPRAG